MPKVSFVLPTKDRLEWVGECLQSLLDQTEKDIEVIVVNDGSEDGTKEFLDDFKNYDDRIKVIHNEKSLGGGKSRNIGMDLASSEIICVCDDDDSYPKDRAEKTLEWFKEHPESEMVNFPYVRIDYYGQIMEVFHGEQFDHEGFEKDGKVNYFCNPSAAFKKKSAEEIGGYPTETEDMTDDLQFITNWVKAGKKIDFRPGAVGVLHRVLPNSMMTKHRGFKEEWANA